MKVTPVSSPSQIQDNSTPEHVRTARAVEAFNKGVSSYDKAPTQGQQQEHPVADANNISAEELSAVQQPDQGTITQDNQQPEETVEAATPAVDPEIEKRFQMLAKQERVLRAKVQQQNLKFKEREAALAAREQALQQTQAPDMSQYVPKDRIKNDPLTVLEEAGASFDDLTNQAINRQPTDPRVMNTIQRMQAKVEQLEQELQASKQSQVQQSQDAYKAAVRQIRQDATALVNSDPEFETVKAMGAIKDVVELIEKTYQKDGIVLSVEDAAKEVENYLIDEGMKITQIDKIKKRMAAANASQLKPEVKTQANKQTQPTKTLTNSTGSGRKPNARERAIARANGFTGEF